MSSPICHPERSEGSAVVKLNCRSLAIARDDSLIELRQKLRLLVRKHAVHFQARVRPRANPLAIVQVRLDRRAVPRVSFVIAPARTQRPRPASRAIGLV